MPIAPFPEFGSLSFAAIEELAALPGLPVERWDPPHCGDSGMRIARDGRWFHHGDPIERPQLVRLFARILRREADGGYLLVTPHEKLTIAVEDAPFVAIELSSDGEGMAARLAFGLNTGEVVIAGPGHPLRVARSPIGPRPYLAVRGRLDAAIARPIYYRLAERAVDHDGRLGVWSDSVFHVLEPEA